ncbi:MAG: radical SAM protein [Victivallales bacterium]|nr:radical SAM protein [Victivallales bacterium]
MKHLFGPVPSRRLGMSLGIDLVPHKVCCFDCVYCECGKTTDLTVTRKEYVKYEEVKKELTEYFFNNPDPDFFTFSGSGEPTLNSYIGEILQFLKTEKPKVPAAVLTNGALLKDITVRDELLSADIVLPSLDAAVSTSFQKINLPHSSLNVTDYIGGLIDFRKAYNGKIWLEIFILPGYNDSMENILKLRDVIKMISPDKVQLNTLDRPGRLEDLRSASKTELLKIINIWDLPNTEIVAAFSVEGEKKNFRNDIKNTILETLSRRPCTAEDLSSIIGCRITEINKNLRLLESENKLVSEKLKRGVFYKTKINSYKEKR